MCLSLKRFVILLVSFPLYINVVYFSFWCCVCVCADLGVLRSAFYHNYCLLAYLVL
jgi:hypothetical protein